jgi:hypothetical protein
MELDESYFSHIPLLAAAVAKTAGPVLELGAGLGSTLMLHGLCGAMGRQLVTLDSDQDWLNKFTNLSRSWHQLKFVNSFHDLLEYRKDWGMAFVDHGIPEQRGQSVLHLQDTAALIVCHDTCHYFLYGYEPTLTGFKYRFNYKPHGIGFDSPMTSIVSRTVDVAMLFAELGL